MALVIEAAIVAAVSRQVRDLFGSALSVRRDPAMERWLPPPHIFSPKDLDTVFEDVLELRGKSPEASMVGSNHR